MITLDNFSAEIRKYNQTNYLESIIEKVNNREGYISLIGNHVVFNKYLTGSARKNRDLYIKNFSNGKASIDLPSNKVIVWKTNLKMTQKEYKN